MKLIATFTPQAWINGYSTAVDAPGEVSWDVTEHLRAMTREEATKACERDTNHSDSLREIDGAPDWAKDWTGPFFISVAPMPENQVDEHLCKLLESPAEVFEWDFESDTLGRFSFTNKRTNERGEVKFVGTSTVVCINPQTDPAPTEPTLQDELRALVERGLDFGNVIEVMGMTAEEHPMIAAAQQLAREGEIEVDDKAILSEGASDGCYVSCWLWVPSPDTDEEQDEQEGVQPSPLAA